MKVVFRVDASLDIGNGHVMRCLTLAEALRKRGAECHFLCREHPGHLIGFIRGKGCHVHVLPIGTVSLLKDGVPNQPTHAAWLGTNQAEDAAVCMTVLEGLQPDWLIIDHYALDARWEEALAPCCVHLMVIDDLADRPHSCDLLLDQNLGRETSDYEHLVPERCTVLTGPKYALLRPEFRALREYSLKRRAKPALGNILITMGGVDQYNATGKVLDALKHCSFSGECRINVVMGPEAPWLDQIRTTAGEMPWQTEVLVNVSQMAQIMADTDLAIGAPGSTAWERCCLGVPTLMIWFAENQLPGGRALHAFQAAILMGEVGDIALHLRPQFETIVEHMEFISAKARQVTDGCGTSRIVKLMGNIDG